MVMMMGKDGEQEERKSEDEGGEKRARVSSSASPSSVKPSTPTSAAAAPVNPSTPAPTVDLTDPNSKPNLQLPQGWIIAWSRSNKRWYFNHIPTKRSVWEYHLVK